jgi:hypothetical protein
MKNESVKLCVADVARKPANEKPPADNCKPSLQLSFEPWQDDLAAKIDEVTRGYVNTVLRVGELVNTWSKLLNGKWGDKVVGQIASHPQIHCTRQWLYRCWQVYKCLQEYGDDLKRFDLSSGLLIQLSRVTQKKQLPVGTEAKTLLLECAGRAHKEKWTVDRARQEVSERLCHRKSPTSDERFERTGKCIDRATQAVNLAHQELTSSNPRPPSAPVTKQLHRQFNSVLHSVVAFLQALPAEENADGSRYEQLADEYERLGKELTSVATSLRCEAAKKLVIKPKVSADRSRRRQSRAARSAKTKMDPQLERRADTNYRCENCGHISAGEKLTDTSPGPLWECSECDEPFVGESSECETCGRRCHKRADWACPKCEGAMTEADQADEAPAEPDEDDNADEDLSSDE